MATYCKYCRKPLLSGLSRLRNFCSLECRKAYRLTYQANLMKGERKKTRQKVASGDSGSNFEKYGGEKWYEMAKTYCCEFESKEKTGLCSMLSEPYYMFRITCDKCRLGRLLADKYRKELLQGENK